MEEIQQRLRYFFSALFFVALFFWAWALKNTMDFAADGGMDLGVISFGAVMITSSYMHGALTAAASANGLGSSWLMKKITTASHLLVALNYLAGAYLGFFVMARAGFGLYCVIFTFLWLAVAYYGNQMMNQFGGEEMRPLNS